jgi:hypothetical protein
MNELIDKFEAAKTLLEREAAWQDLRDHPEWPAFTAYWRRNWPTSGDPPVSPTSTKSPAGWSWLLVSRLRGFMEASRRVREGDALQRMRP